MIYALTQKPRFVDKHRRLCNILETITLHMFGPAFMFLGIITLIVWAIPCGAMSYWTGVLCIFVPWQTICCLSAGILNLWLGLKINSAIDEKEASLS